MTWTLVRGDNADRTYECERRIAPRVTLVAVVTIPHDITKPAGVATGIRALGGVVCAAAELVPNAVARMVVGRAFASAPSKTAHKP